MNFKFLQGQTITFQNEKGQTETGKVQDVRTNPDGSQRITMSNPDEMIDFDLSKHPMEIIIGKTMEILKDADELVELIKQKRIEKDNKFMIELSETTPFDLYELSTCKEIYKLSNDQLKQRATSAIKFGLSISHYCLMIKEFQNNTEKK
jgi:hypothetical protein